MNKIALDPQSSLLMNQLGQDALVGAGIGALGMGAVSALSPEERKKRSLLKSMMLGAGLGGVMGGGGRAILNAFSETARNSPDSAAKVISTQTLNPPDKPRTVWQNARDIAADGALGMGPVSTGVIGGIGTSYLSKILQRIGTGKVPKFHEAPLRSPALHGLLGAGMTYGLAKGLRQYMDDETRFNMVPNNPESWQKLIQQRNGR